jgi:DNA-binding beta-propeller fold protein YncE
MTRQRHWLVVLLWGAAGCFGQQATAVGQDLLVANNTASFNESILRFSATGECLGNFAPTPYRSGPVGLAFDPTGNLYVANHSNNSIHRYSRTGVDLGVFATAGLNMPTGLAFNRRGQLVVCNYGDGSLSFFSATGTWLARVNTGLLNPLALALDSCDNIFVSIPNLGANSGVFRFEPSGTQRTLFAAGIDLDPRGLAFDRTGNLYVANQHGSSVRRYSAEGTFLDTFAATGLRDPFALAFDACGDLYISNQAGGTIRHYSACGEDLGIFATVPSTFANPVGLAFLPVPEPTVPVLLLFSTGFIRLISNRRRPAPTRHSPAHKQRMN